MGIAFNFFSALLLGVGAQNSNYPTATAEAPVSLRESGTVVMEMANFYGNGNGQCDASGNLYFNTARDFNASSIMKIKQDGTRSFYVTPPVKEESYFVAFRVSSSGNVYVLNAGREKLFVFELHSDSGDATATELSAPRGLEPTNFLVLPDGQILVHGYFTEKADSRNQGRSYIGYFSALGKLLRDSLPETTKSLADDVKSNSWTLTAAAAAVSENGRGYLLSGDDIFVISSTEGLIHTIQLKPPEEGYRPLNVFAIAGRLLVTFIKKQEKWPLPALYQMLDPSTGEQIRTYKPSEEMGNNLVCFSKEGFTFLRFEVGKERLKLISAKP